ncbi:O-antigen ligase family protein [Sphingomonas sp. RS2018]
MTRVPPWMQKYKPSLAFVLLGMLFGVLWLAGGASRSDVAGQLISRGAAFAGLIAVLIFSERSPLDGAGIVAGLFAAIVALPLLQLCPLPPGLWRSLAGREAIAQLLPETAETWRPLSLSPGNTVNAAMSLIVPAATLAMVWTLRPRERNWLPFLILCLVLASTFVGLLQFSGVHISQTLINYSNDVRGTFANRNHFALLLAIGCLILPYCALAGGARSSWTTPVAIGLLPLLILTVLASGSRMGLLLTGVGIVLGGLAVREPLSRLWRRRSRTILAGALIGSACIGAMIFAAIKFDRAVSIERIASADVGQDMRVRALPTVRGMLSEYAPVGSGLGSFDPVFRLHEPFGLLKPTYFNRAHNDFLEVVLDSGILGLVLIAAASLWWLLASWRVWQAGLGDRVVPGRLGSGIIVLVALASIVDYPARTSLVMAILAIASALLCWGAYRKFASDRT